MFVLAFNNTTVNVPNNPINNTNNRVLRNSHTKYFLPRVNITNYNVLIDGRNFYDQPINDIIKQYDEIRKIATGQGDDYTTGCLLDYQYFKDHYNLIAIDLSKQKELDADSRAIQQIEFYGMLKTNSQVCTVLEKSKETMLEFYKGTTKTKNKTGTTLRVILEIISENDLPHELLLTTRQKTKLRNAFNNNTVCQLK